jgi:hypothetical protein
MLFCIIQCRKGIGVTQILSAKDSVSGTFFLSTVIFKQSHEGGVIDFPIAQMEK